MANKKRIVVLAAVVAAVLGTAAAVWLLWKPEPKGIVVGTSTLPDSLNPVLEQNTSALNANELVFDGLVNFEVDPASGKTYPDLALAERIDQDPRTKKTYRVSLRETAWHDGAPFTAEDVVFSFQAYTNEANWSPKRDYLSSFIESVKAIDERTVEFEFRKPIPPFRVYPVLTFKIIPSSFRGRKLSANLRSGENERLFSVEPIGTGPFKIGSWEIGKWVSFDANAAYFKRMPASGSVVIRKVIDPVIRLNEFRKGRINLILETSPLDRAAAERIPGTDINWYRPYAFYQVAINTRAPLFSRSEARTALSAALDRSALVPQVTDREQGVVINYGPFPADLFARNLPEYRIEPLRNAAPYDASAARKLAVKGGVAGKTAILLYPDSLGEFGGKMAEGISAQLGAIGVKVEPKRTGDQVFRRLVFIEKSYDLALLYSEGFDNLFSDLDKWFRSDGANNVYGVADEQLDRMFDDWGRTVVTTDWVAATRRIHERVSELAPAVFLVTMEKDVYSRGLRDVSIVSDNPFLSAEDWSLAG